tara:strand:- start:1367 stop:1762 length:396 start_codon:yes stop_codon:yes gene_type:complete
LYGKIADNLGIKKVDKQVVMCYSVYEGDEMSQLFVTWKQIDKYVLLCEKYGNSAMLESMNYILVNETSDKAEPLPRWYGDAARGSEEYVIIMPSGEHYYHDDYLLFNISQWIRGFYPRETKRESKSVKGES